MSDKKTIWTSLLDHANSMRSIHMRDLFQHDPNRATAFSIALDELYFDYSKNLITKDTLQFLIQLANATDIQSRIQAMFSGEKINISENRAVLHTALRAGKDSVINVDGENIVPFIYEQLDKIEQFTTRIHQKEYTGWTGKPIDTFINIGIGGAGLGPKLVVDALTPFRKENTKSYFISNLDYQPIEELISKIEPETSLFIISSKSFSTLETLTNANSLWKWMLDKGCTAINKHFVAISSNIEAAVNFGINPDNIFSIWDWLGGRFSLWSASGLPIALALGFDNFRQLLDGANLVDEHFKKAKPEKNIPFIMGLLDVWYNNFLDADSHVFVPYDESLRLLPEYLSQLLMESNGKSTNLDGELVDYETMPVVWGSTGTNAQHAYFQLLHQGSKLIPVDFLAPLVKQGNKDHHALMLANCFAQSQALMQGEQSHSPQKIFPGNKPSNTLLYKSLNAKTLGMLLAIFEHRTFVQGVIWDINSFDQWGVELGKKLAKNVYANMLTKDEDAENIDSSTKALINLYKQKNL